MNSAIFFFTRDICIYKYMHMISGTLGLGFRVEWGCRTLGVSVCGLPTLRRAIVCRDLHWGPPITGTITYTYTYTSLH